jgi:hypothetical protein
MANVGHPVRRRRTGWLFLPPPSRRGLPSRNFGGSTQCNVQKYGTNLVNLPKIAYTCYHTDSCAFSIAFEDQVRQLTSININEIETHYYAAIEAAHGSGEHWTLMTVLDKYGFRTNSPTRAIELADQIIVL